MNPELGTLKPSWGKIKKCVYWVECSKEKKEREEKIKRVRPTLATF